MDHAIVDVKRLFEVRLSELGVLEAKLNHLLRNKFPKRESSSSPAALFARLRTIAKELPTLVDEVQRVELEKEEVGSVLNRLASASSSQLSLLQTSCKVSTEMPPQEPQLSDEHALVSSDSRAAVHEEPAITFGVSEREFEEVSMTVRGRVTLDEVNALYKVIYSYFEQDPKSSALSISKLTKLGAKASGLKAQNAINTLRQLKKIEVTKDGILLGKIDCKKRKNRV